jgi:hypothetical protein
MHSCFLKQATSLVSARRQHCVATGAHLDELIQDSGTGGSMMHIREMPSQYVPLQGAKVAEPPFGAGVVPLLSHLPHELQELYAQLEGLFRKAGEAKAILQRQNRCFSRVLGSRDEYMRYFARPQV